jgi:hypothetical protein
MGLLCIVLTRIVDHYEYKRLRSRSFYRLGAGPIPREDAFGLAIELKQILLGKHVESIKAGPIVEKVYLRPDQAS